MLCPKCRHEQSAGMVECERCGIIIEKFLARQAQRGDHFPDNPVDRTSASEEREPETFGAYVLDCLFYVERPVNPLYLIGRALLYLLLAIWGERFIFASIESNYVSQSFMHLINLPFHEAGHVIFSPFGRFISVLGGTLGQLLMPLICCSILLLKTRDAFGASIALWWLGQSFMDIAPYINDARDLNLILLGGVTGNDVVDYHDWEYILGKVGWLRYDHTLAHVADKIGMLLMITAFVWGGYILYKQFQARDRFG